LEPLLYLVHRLPYPPNKGDKIRSYHLLRYLAARYRVHLGTFVDSASDEGIVVALRELCADVCAVRLHPTLARLRSVTGLLHGEALTVPYYRDVRMRRWVETTLRERPIRKAVVFSSPMVQYVAGARGLRLIADYCDVDSAKWSDYAPQHRWPMSFVYRREGRLLLAFERERAQQCDACVFATEAEKSLFASLAPECAPRLHAIGNGVDPQYFAPRADRPSPYASSDEVLVFTGVMDYWPNIDAVTWFAKEVLPRLIEARPRLRFFIVGMNPSVAVRELAKHPAVVVTGKVDDVRPYVQHALAVVAPLRIARGIQNKVIEAMSMGRPVVVSEAAARGLCARAGSDFIRAGRSPEEFAAAVLELRARPDREAVGRCARAAVLAAYDWDRNLSSFGALLESHTA
jgi:sugar transferase (PEP-CTERM/EpsH1 system associated)